MRPQLHEDQELEARRSWVCLKDAPYVEAVEGNEANLTCQAQLS